MNDLNELVACYNSTLSLLMDRYAPLQSKRVTKRLRIPLFNRIAECKLRKTKSEKDLAVFKQRKNYATFLMNKVHCTYYHHFVQENSVDQARLSKATKTLLTEPRTLSLPDRSDAEVVANDIGKYFVQKVHNIHPNLNNTTVFDDVTDSGNKVSFSVVLSETT